MTSAPYPQQTAPDDAVSRTELARRFVESLVSGTAVDDRPTFDHTALKGLTVVEVAEGRIVCEMPVSERVQNRYGTLHGGATATLVDTISTAALLTCCPHSGVSVHLAVTYLAPMPGSKSSPGTKSKSSPNTSADPSMGRSPSPGAGGAGDAIPSAPGSRSGESNSDAGQQSRKEEEGVRTEAEVEAEVVVVDARVTRVGRQLASLAVELRRKASGQLVATGTHTKFLQVADPAMDTMRARAGAAARGAPGGREGGAGPLQMRSRL